MKTNGRSGARENGHRLSGYITAEQKAWWDAESRRVAKEDDLRNASMGVLFSRIAKYRLKLDDRSLREYAAKTKPSREHAVLARA